MTTASGCVRIRPMRVIADVRLAVLDPAQPTRFPPVASALRDPDGLLAAGGDLSPERLLAAYAHGIFPWYSQDEPILWWSPDPRTVFKSAAIHVPRRLARWLRGCNWTVGADQAFTEVMQACGEPRRSQPTTWIMPDMVAAYVRLHALGHAHSVEVRDAAGDLVGGLYGVALGRMFFGESMFSRRDNASKLSLIALAQVLAHWEMPLIDAQIASSHLTSLGAFVMPRAQFVAQVATLVAMPPPSQGWPEVFATLRPAKLLLGEAQTGDA